MPTFDAISSDVIESTLLKWSPTVYDNITMAHPLISNLKKNGHIKTVKGSYGFREAIQYSANKNGGWQSIRGQIPTQITDIFSHAEFYPRFAIKPVGIWLDEEIQNRGEAAQYDVMETRTKNTVEEFTQDFGAYVYNRVAADYKMEGLPMLVADNPVGDTVGGIERDDAHSWWRNQTLNISTFFDVDAADPITPEMLHEAMCIMEQRLDDVGADISSIYCATDLYNMYRHWLESKHINNDRRGVGDMQFTSLEFDGITMYRDKDCPSGHMYFLDEKFIWMKCQEGYDFKFKKPREPYDYFKRIIPLTFYGCFSAGNLRKQGVVFLGRASALV